MANCQTGRSRHGAGGIVVDNGSSHRGAASAERMASTWPTAYLIHLPAHASRLGQAEIYFSVVRRKPSPPTISPAWIRSATVSPRSRDPLQRYRSAIYLEVHPHRPPGPVAPDRRARQNQAPCSGGLISTLDELTGPTTKSQIVSRAHVPGRSASTDRITSPHQVSSSVSRSG